MAQKMFDGQLYSLVSLPDWYIILYTALYAGQIPLLGGEGNPLSGGHTPSWVGHTSIMWF